MEKAEVQRVVEAVFREMRKDLQIMHWRIDIGYDRLESDAAMQCHCMAAYHRAYISIDAENQESEKNVIQNLRHELIHVMLADMFHYRDTVHRYAGCDVAEVLDDVHTFALERNVWAVEMMLDYGYGIGIEKYMAMLEQPEVQP